MRLFRHELRGQLKLYWRSRELAFFTFALPIIMFFLLGSVYGNDRIKSEGGVRGADYLLAGMLGYGAISTGFAGLSILLVIRREAGILKRLRATPLPASTLIAALLATFLIAFAIESVVMIGLGRIFFDTHVQHAVSLALVLLLGAGTFTALGLALTSVIRSAEGASAMVNAIYLPVSFISGAFFSAHSFPQVLRAIGDALPLVYVIRLCRDVMLRGSQIWDRPSAVAVIAAWGIAGAIVAARRFRWEPAEG
ncbi:MAG: ABC transporter permease [Actinomycetota bacterium]|nr:ABC transporter permease [Actinomycetota bacterium]